MSFTKLQQRLQGIYELELEHQVNDFIVTSREQLRPGIESYINARETLLVCQDDDDLLLSLYLHEGVVNNLVQDDGDLHLHNDNIEDFCLALEGVSHFIYLAWNAGFQRCVTRLEMEIQAEIDKFIMLSNLLINSREQPDPGRLRRLLFDAVQFSRGLSVTERARYRDANNFAAKYCWYLETNGFLKQGLEQVLLRELRRFYRLDLRGKLRRIDCFH